MRPSNEYNQATTFTKKNEYMNTTSREKKNNNTRNESTENPAPTEERKEESEWERVNEQIYSFIFANPTNLLENYVIL